MAQNVGLTQEIEKITYNLKNYFKYKIEKGDTAIRTHAPQLSVPIINE